MDVALWVGWLLGLTESWPPVASSSRAAATGLESDIAFWARPHSLSLNPESDKQPVSPLPAVPPAQPPAWPLEVLEKHQAGRGSAPGRAGGHS